jgi:hypothetical protein
MTPQGSAPPGYGSTPPSPAPPHPAVALACGLGTGLGWALAWGVLAYYVHHDLDLLAVVSGPLVGCTVARLRPRDLPTAAGSALVTVVVCALGQFLVGLFGLAGVGVTVSSILGHLGLIISGYPDSIGLRAAGAWASAAALAFWIPLHWAGRPRTPAWRR